MPLAPRTDVARKRNEGFSLIELAVVLMVIVVIIATVAPSLTEVLADGRQSSAGQSVFRVSRRARWEAIGDGVAQLLWVKSAVADGTLGTVQVFRGMGPRCDQVDWAQAIGHGPLEGHSYDLSSVNTPGNTKATDGDQIIWLAVEDNVGTAVADLYLCYQPNGAAFIVDPANPATAPVAQASQYKLTITRTYDGLIHGSDRRVLLPVEGTPWVN